VFFVSSDIEDKICILYITENQCENYTEALKLSLNLSFFDSLTRQKGVQNYNLIY